MAAHETLSIAGHVTAIARYVTIAFSPLQKKKSDAWKCHSWKINERHTNATMILGVIED